MLNKLVYYGWIIFCVIDLCMRDTQDNIAIADIIVIIGCLICLETRNLKD